MLINELECIEEQGLDDAMGYVPDGSWRFGTEQERDAYLRGYSNGLSLNEDLARWEYRSTEVARRNGHI